MIAADSSYLIEAILRDAGLFAGETFVAPDLALYEVVNVIWKHEAQIRDIREASRYLDVVDDLISSEAIMLVRPDGSLVREAYSLSLKHEAPFYDMVFVALALKLDLELRTFDKEQSRIFSEEKQAIRKANV